MCFMRSQAFVQSVRQWDSPPRSVGAMATIVLGCYHPHILATAVLALLVLYGLHRHSPDAGACASCCARMARLISPEQYGCIVRGLHPNVTVCGRARGADAGRTGPQTAHSAAVLPYCRAGMHMSTMSRRANGDGAGSC